MGRLLSRNEKFVRLFTTYETGLVDYNRVFQQSTFSIDYIVQINKLSADYYVQLIFSVLKNPKFNPKETRSLRKILENYSSVFSINDIRIIRPMKRTIDGILIEREIKPIEERIYLEFCGLFNPYENI